MGKKYFDTKGGTLESSILDVWKQAAAVTETNKNDKSDDGEGLDAVQKDAVKKKFKDRKDKDIDNDGDTDSSDEYLHKKRKAISKKKEEFVKEGYIELEFKDKRKAIQAFNYINNKIWAGGHPPYDDFNQEGSSLQIDTDGNLNRRNDMLKDLKALPRDLKFKVVVNEEVDEDVDLDDNAEEFTQNAYFRVQSMRDALHKVWGEAHVPGHDEDEDDEKVKGPKAKTDTGKKAAKVETKPEISEKKKKSIKSGYGSY